MVKRLLTLTIFLLNLAYCNAQKWIGNIHGGVANYQGDLQELPFTFEKVGVNVGFSLHYALTNKIGVRAYGGYGKIKGSDESSSKKGNRSRNLSFENKILEFHIGAEYLLFDMDRKTWSPYVFAGLGIFTHKPYAFDQVGNKVFLQPLGTEGQGLPEYPERKLYKLNDITLPIGGGIRVAVTDMLKIGYEIGFRKTFTDYIDDVSDRYPDEVKLLNRRGAKAVAMSYRGGEVFGGNPVFPIENTPRGSVKNKDWYYFQSITIGLNLFSKDGTGLFGGGNKYGTKCPSVF